MGGDGLDRAGSGQGQVAGSCECGNEPIGFHIAYDLYHKPVHKQRHWRATQYNTTQHNTQHNTTQHTAQHNTTQHTGPDFVTFGERLSAMR